MKYVKQLLKMVIMFCLAFSLVTITDTNQIYADNSSDFNINTKQVLVKYNGPGGSVVIPEGVTTIGRKAFSGCTTITSVKFPSSVTSIEESAFDSCGELTAVELSSKLKYIGNNAFSNCTSLKSIVIPSSVEEIGICAFCHCDLLTEMYIPKNVNKIGTYAFGYLFVNGKYSPVVGYTIMGEEGTQAQKYAEENENIQFLVKSDLAAKINKISNTAKGKAKITWIRNPNTSGYEIQYATNKKFSKAKTITASAANGSKTISSMKKGNTYYFRVRGYRSVAGTKYYSNWSSSKSIKIKK